ncbi:MAG: hypothetical protein EOP09_19435, partial [Proteobacteria bacterium]
CGSFSAASAKACRNPSGGLSTSDIDISTFMESLSKSVFLQDVVLISSAEQVQEGLSLKKFEIACMLDTTGTRQ